MFNRRWYILKQFKPFLEHIINEINYLQQNSDEIVYEEFVNNETFKRSFVRALEVIGEAIKNLPDDFRNKYPQIQWKEMAGLRDILIHRYFGVDYKSVWDIIKNKIPHLKGQIENILSKIEYKNES
jgi:uncharacterized protein with HEPN domain